MDQNIDRVSVSVDSQYGSSWRVDIDFERGVLIREGTEHTIPSSTLAGLRSEAEAAHAQGDHSYREQFADGCVNVTIELGGERVTLLYASWGDCDCERVAKIYKYVRTSLNTP